MLQSRCVTLGKRIAARRRALGWSQNELARRAEVNHPTLYKIEADQRLNPSVSVVVRHCAALGTSAEALYGLERDETRLFVEAKEATMVVEVRTLGRKVGEAARARAQALSRLRSSVPARAFAMPRLPPPARTKRNHVRRRKRVSWRRAALR